ncbi:MAG: hypothetical protein HFJ75_05460 [Eggerthellaceae bacterium]|nr:hypothetical protein [Eggerthellaceae bacterium]
MPIVVAVLLGALSGIVGFLPLFAGLRMTRKTVSSGLVGSMMVLFLALIVSFIILVMAAVFCIAFDRALGLPFVAAEVIALSAAAIAYGMSTVARK